MQAFVSIGALLYCYVGWTESFVLFPPQKILSLFLLPFMGGLELNQFDTQFTLFSAALVGGWLFGMMVELSNLEHQMFWSTIDL